ncbi:MAG: hypothetical protein ACTS10_18595 [Kiloniellales bacterium]
MITSRHTFAAAFLSASLTLAGGAAAASDAQVCRSMGGLGNYNYAEDGRSGVAAMAGDLAGGVYFRQVGEFVTLENGALEGRFKHMFVTADGSTIRTEDVSWAIPVEGSDYLVGGAAYSVVEATGAFEGFTGTFHSWGTFAPHKGQAVLRYDGQICRSTEP